MEEIETKKGITTHDTLTGQPYCIRVTAGQSVTVAGACGDQTNQSDQTNGTNETNTTTPAVMENSVSPDAS